MHISLKYANGQRWIRTTEAIYLLPVYQYLQDKRVVFLLSVVSYTKLYNSSLNTLRIAITTSHRKGILIYKKDYFSHTCICTWCVWNIPRGVQKVPKKCPKGVVNSPIMIALFRFRPFKPLFTTTWKLYYFQGTGSCCQRKNPPKNWEGWLAGTGFEPATFGLWARRASRLLYPALLVLTINTITFILSSVKTLIHNLYNLDELFILLL